MKRNIVKIVGSRSNPLIKFDLFQNGNFVKSFNTKEEVDKWFQEQFENKLSFYWNAKGSDIQCVKKHLDEMNFSLIQSEHLSLS